MVDEINVMQNKFSLEVAVGSILVLSPCHIITLFKSLSTMCLSINICKIYKFASTDQFIIMMHRNQIERGVLLDTMPKNIPIIITIITLKNIVYKLGS